MALTCVKPIKLAQYLSLCVCAQEYRCGCMCLHMRVEARRDPRASVLRSHPPCSFVLGGYLFEMRSLTGTWSLLMRKPWLASEPQGSVPAPPHPPRADITNTDHHTQSFLWTQGWNSGPHVCLADTSMTQLSTQFLLWLFYWNIFLTSKQISKGFVAYTFCRSS